MKISDLISMCLQNLSRRKIRTVLTTMGVVIGTCSIVVMISLGVGLQKSQEAMLAEIERAKKDMSCLRPDAWRGV